MFEPIDSAVLMDAVKQLERAARVLETLRYADTATETNERKYQAKLSEVRANIHAALARIGE